MQQEERDYAETPSAVWNIAAQSFIHHIKCLLKFVKKVPGNIMVFYSAATSVLGEKGRVQKKLGTI